MYSHFHENRELGAKTMHVITIQCCTLDKKLKLAMKTRLPDLPLEIFLFGKVGTLSVTSPLVLSLVAGGRRNLCSRGVKMLTNFVNNDCDGIVAGNKMDAFV